MFNFIKKAVIANRVEESILYEYVLDELDEGFKVRGLWGKALAMSDGDINKANSLYLQYRVQNIRDTFISLKIAYEELTKNQIKNQITKLKSDVVIIQDKLDRSIDKNELEYERISCPHCSSTTYLNNNNCFKCNKNLRKIDQDLINQYENHNNKKFIIKNKIEKEILDYVGNDFKTVRKALDLNKNENCGLNDYFLDKNDFEHLILRHGSHYLLVSNYGIKIQFDLT